MHPQLPKQLDNFLELSLHDLLSSERSATWSEKWVGQQIDVYRIEKLLGTGTHGVVFSARRTKPFEQMVAIKLLPNLQGQANATHFQNECQALADLEHRNICQILNAGLTEDGTPYLVISLLSGLTIDRYVDESRADDVQITELVRQLAEALAFAHARGVVHCDLKPDNILVDCDGQVTVTDFGLAVRINEMNERAQGPSWVPGTIGYAAPEILGCRKDASQAVDVYSLGAILYRLLTGEAPHASTDWLESLVSVATKRS